MSFCHRRLICAYALPLAGWSEVSFLSFLKVNAHSSVISVGHLLLRKVTSSATLNCTQGKNLLSVTSATMHAREETHSQVTLGHILVSESNEHSISSKCCVPWYPLRKLERVKYGGFNPSFLFWRVTTAETSRANYTSIKALIALRLAQWGWSSPYHPCSPREQKSQTGKACSIKMLFKFFVKNYSYQYFLMVSFIKRLFS